jgi:hypothetical protein
MHASDYLENALIDHVFRTAAFAKPAALYVALFTATPTDAGGGTEVTGGAYARVSVPPGDATWTATQGGATGASTGTGGTTQNAAVIRFPAPTADWGTVTHLGIFDAVTAGRLLVWGPLSTPRPILSGESAPLFPIGALAVAVG